MSVGYCTENIFRHKSSYVVRKSVRLCSGLIAWGSNGLRLENDECLTYLTGEAGKELHSFSFISSEYVDICTFFDDILI